MGSVLQSEDRVIVLRSVNYQERDRIVTGLSEGRGKVTARAHHAIQSKRFGGGLELFTLGRWSLTFKNDQEFGTVLSVDAQYDFPALRTDLDRLALASFLAEVFLRLELPNEPAPELFKLLVNTLRALENCPVERGITVINAFLAKLLFALGHHPAFHACDQCGLRLSEMTAPEVAVGTQNVVLWCVNCPRTEGVLLSRTLIEEYLTVFSQPVRLAAAQVTTTPDDQLKLFRVLLRVIAFHIPGLDPTTTHSFQSLRFLQLEGEA